MHITDWFTTIVHAAGLTEPTDRIIDGVSQLDWLTGKQSVSNRDGFIYWMGSEMYGVKWRDFKLALIAQKYSTDPIGRLVSPRIINLVTDPPEREPISATYLHSWTVQHFNRILGEYHHSVRREPLIPSGAPLEFVPAMRGM